MDEQLSISELLYRWPGSGRRLRIDKLTLMPGERAMLRGVSGSGKSTLLNLIAGVLTPDSGSMTLAGNDLMNQSAGQRDRIRAESMGIIFQQFNLLPYLNVHDNILLPLTFAPERKRRVSNPEQEVRHLLEAMELSEKLLERPVTSLSVGQQQRVAVARALLGAPPLILADEPTSALDPVSRDRFMDLLLEQCQVAGSSLLLVSHDPELSQCVDEEYALNMDEFGTEVQPC